ncbi:MAG: glycosyltransferase family 4 protein [Spirochaetaceae bacterium]|nr:MAG: glycosyltransferase family 4 protein [Spirochaetaceae bacterium]
MEKIRICMIHGYLLTGTGSNIFVANLVRNLCRLGHDVFLFCQEKHAEDIDFISQHSVFEPGNREYQILFSRETRYPGKCNLFNPEIRGLLPVYVYDEYEGFKVKTFPKMKIGEIEDYIRQNVEAVETIYLEKGFDLIQTNHVIMSPYIARIMWKKHDIPYYVTLHGSALNFSVRNDLRLRPYATKALLGATRIFAVSNHNHLEALTFFKRIASRIEGKFTVIPAGVDTDLFRILDNSRRKSIDELQSILKERLKVLPNGKSPEQKRRFLQELEETSSVDEVDELVSKYNAEYSQGHPDRDIVATLKRIDWKNGWVLLFVGKYLWTKGIQMVISALPIVLNAVPDLHLLLVGFGSYREELEALVYSLASGRRELFRYLIERSISQMQPGEEPCVEKPFKFLDALTHRKEVKSYFDSAERNAIAEHVHFLGALSHAELGRLLPCADGFVAASVCPEAFGMVSIEALACGVLPIISNQTGFKEIVDLVSGSVYEVNESPKVNIDEDMIFNIAENIIQNIRRGNLRNPELKKKFRKLTVDHFSWESIANQYVSYYRKDTVVTNS